MANYTVADIQALRERTGAGMLDVKKALDEAEGDLDKAVDILRVKGLKGVTKREGRSASEGLVAASIADADGGQVGTLIELNSETDFVAKNDKFVALADTVLAAVVAALEPVAMAGNYDGAEFAGLADELAVREEQAQPYGTQTRCVDGTTTLYEIAGPDTLDERREALGLPPLDREAAEGADCEMETDAGDAGN